MFELNGWVVFGLVLVAYAVALVLLYRAGRIGPERSLSLFMGVALMLKTQRGKATLERVGRFRRFWSVVGDVGILLAAVAMVVIVGLLAIEAILVTQVPASVAPSPQTALGLPGINPIIPIGYGILALVVGVVLHELFHGVIARSQGVGVKSIGVLWLVVPVGAFVEQDDADMGKVSRRRKSRIVAAGVLANFVLCVVFFSASAVVLDNGVAPNAHGVGIDQVLSGYPAGNASLAPGDILVALNGSGTPNNDQLFDALDATHPGERVNLTYYDHRSGSLVSTAVTLAPAEEYTGLASDAHRGFLGISITPLDPTELTGILAAPWNAPGGALPGFAAWIILPILELQPVQGTTTQYYHATGPFQGLGVANVWVGVNVLYWLAWMNLLLGLSNALPLVPFDGGLLFQQFAGSVLAKVRSGWDAARNERVSQQASYVASFLLVFLIVWLFVGPRL